jgi:hypothetical protein
MMGMGAEEESTMLYTMEEQEASPEQELDGDAVLSFLEEIWLQNNEELTETISESEWNAFMESVENAY